MDTGLIKELTDILNKENDIYETFLKLSNSKTDLITNGNVSELESIVKIEQSLIIKIAKLEDQREKIVESLSSVLGRKPEEVTISELSSCLGEKEAMELKACQEKILKSINGLKSNNELNSKLIKNSLEYIDFSINMMTTVGTVTNSYGSSGNADEGKKRNLFDVKL
ncbi:flagellar protein FlgN [Ruminiclostridium cellulolyticum]|uniref:FlgN family protein n=1 Tax=Ruminiclostridium cellulolyticum (strain ATCC 35319 / DSM 5812 / JCM 6584 / H10) TaxID=394503 RepID=B8I4C7_RUMCH|nr:flagellar protein FlgN [Ruminiclostridium cellulolyticum]ACL74481.1 FlgN family protein [Ruminiclostridium cellulolyticum H10]